jgi:hypothetical protein
MPGGCRSSAPEAAAPAVALDLEQRIGIAVPPAHAFPLLIEPRSWKSWWPAVKDARSLDFKPLREGSRFEVTLQLGRLTGTLHPRVGFCADGRSLAWDARWLGVPLRQEWFLEPRPDGSRAVLRSRFGGAGAGFLKLFRLDRRWQRMLDEQAKGLKRAAERL